MGVLCLNIIQVRHLRFMVPEIQIRITFEISNLAPPKTLEGEDSTVILLEIATLIHRTTVPQFESYLRKR